MTAEPELRAVFVLGGLVSLCACGRGGEEPEELRSALVEKIVARVRAGATVGATVDLFGSPMRGKIVAADAEGFTFKAMGTETVLRWGQLPPRRFYHAARRACDDASAAEHALLGRYLAAAGETELAKEELHRALALDASLAETVKPVLEGLEPKRKLPKVPAVFLPPAKPKAPERPEELTIRAGAPVASAPAWAAAELEAFAALERAYGRFVRDCVRPDGLLENVTEGLGHSTIDDIMEVIGPWDKYLLMAGSKELQRAYSKTCCAYLRLAEKKKWFVKGFYRNGNDAEHAGEFYIYLAGALEVDPQNPFLREANRKWADTFVYSRLYNAKTQLMRTVWPSSVRVNRRAGLAGDYVQNLIYTSPAARAYMTTRDEKYRRWVLEYGKRWGELAKANNDVFPYQVDDETLEVGPFSNGRWWLGPEGGSFTSLARDIRAFDYDKYGIAVVARALRSYPVAMALVDRGEPGHADALRAMVEVLFKTGSGGRPSTEYKEATGWTRGRWGSVVPTLLDRVYLAAFDPAAAERIRAYSSVASGEEMGALRWMRMTYLGERNDGYAVTNFRATKENAEKALAELDRIGGELPRLTGDLEVLGKYTTGAGRTLFVDGSIWGCGIWDGNRDGGLSTASVRYYRDDGSSGMPKGVAAFVRHVGPDSLKVSLYNDNAGAARVRLVAGHYGQHRFDAVMKGSDAVKVGDRKLTVELGPKSAAEVSLRMTRDVYRPSLLPLVERPLPWPPRR